MKQMTILIFAAIVLMTAPARSDDSKVNGSADKNSEGEMIDADKAEDFFVAEFSEDLTATLRPVKSSN
ncbi:MAG: hypothetical protein ABL958_20435 [Bdellovibrionia bacterium]